jgi:hypothetical protein
MSKSRVAVGRKIEGELEARRCLLTASREGLSAGEWARAHGIDGRSLHAWQMNLERRGTTARSRRRKSRTSTTTRALVELVPAAPNVTITGRGRYVLEVAGARVEFGDDASVATLRRVLEALRSC